MDSGFLILKIPRNSDFQECLLHGSLIIIKRLWKSNLILLPNSPQAAGDMFNNMLVSFVAADRIGSEMDNNKSEE